MVKMRTRRGGSAALASLPRPLNARIYRARFRPFESTKYLEVSALRKVARTVIEVGTLEVPGVSCTLAAEIRKGMITDLKPLPCAGCDVPRIGAARLRRILRAATRQLAGVTGARPRLPVPLAISRRRGLGLTIGLIVIVIDEDAPCIWIWYNGNVCIVCTYGWICD